MAYSSKGVGSLPFGVGLLGVTAFRSNMSRHLLQLPAVF